LYPDVCAQAAIGGHFEVVQWARANGYPWGEYTCSKAAEGGHLDVLQLARANGCPWDWQTRIHARLIPSILEWVEANGLLE
tara:strand:+ start:43500 stop:43742 length:243 start_codon:yes stop_codon:yes gene_type:complete